MKRYSLVIENDCGKVKLKIDSNPSGEWVYYEDVVNMLYDFRSVKYNGELCFGSIVHYFNLPAEYKYLFDKDWAEMSQEEQKIYYNSMAVARLDPVE